MSEDLLVPFIVAGTDGTEYPADHDTLRTWISEGRITEAQRVLDVAGNRWRTAGAVIREYDAAHEAAPAHELHVLIVGAAMLVFGFFVTPHVREWMVARKAAVADGAKSASAAQKEVVEKLARDGSYVYAKLLRTERLRGLYISGRELIFEVPGRDVWEKLPQAERVALSYFIQSQLAVARETPRIFARWGYDLSMFTRTCDTCWYVSTERPSRSRPNVQVVVLMSGGERAGALSTAQDLRSRDGGTTLELNWVVEDLDPRKLFQIPEGYVPRVRAERRDAFGNFRLEEMVDQTPLDAAGAWKTFNAGWPAP